MYHGRFCETSSRSVPKQFHEKWNSILLATALRAPQLPCCTMQSHREISSNKFHEKVSPCNMGITLWTYCAHIVQTPWRACKMRACARFIRKAAKHGTPSETLYGSYGWTNHFYDSWYWTWKTCSLVADACSITPLIQSSCKVLDKCSKNLSRTTNVWMARSSFKLPSAFIHPFS